MKVSKGFEFEAAHRLSNYEGKCKRIHGHNYKGVVTVEGEPDDRGIVIDFSDLKKAIKQYIVEPYDHRLILNNTDDFNQALSTHLDSDWVVWMQNNPTAENMAQHFLQILREQGLPVLAVEVFETDDSSALAQ